MKPETRSFYELAVRGAVQEVIAQLDCALDLHALARRAALSPFHFHRIFRGMVGETPLELHRRLRMERAAYSLLFEDAPVIAIAFAAGYETHESFSRAFRSRYACSPTEFRQRASAGCAPRRIELAARSGIHFRSPPEAAPTIHFIQGGETMRVEIANMPELRVATVRHVGPYSRISEAFARLGAIAGPAGLIGPQAAMIGIYHDDPETTAPAELRSDAAISVAPDAVLPEGVVEQRIAAGRYACAVHQGSYEGLGDAWARLMGEWLPRSGERVATGGVCYERYRNTPGDVPTDELCTELYVPLT